MCVCGWVCARTVNGHASQLILRLVYDESCDSSYIITSSHMPTPSQPPPPPQNPSAFFQRPQNGASTSVSVQLAFAFFWASAAASLALTKPKPDKAESSSVIAVLPNIFS